MVRPMCVARTSTESLRTAFAVLCIFVWVTATGNRNRYCSQGDRIIVVQLCSVLWFMHRALYCYSQIFFFSTEKSNIEVEQTWDLQESCESFDFKNEKETPNL
uniref:Uncharacterized protein n=1 Tax=Amblyomma americanum TaxID=6943 RepID=A0A0C9SEN4_AMBAM